MIITYTWFMKCYYLMEELVFNLRGFSLGLKKPKKLTHVHAYMYKLVSHIIAVRELFEYVKLML